MFHFFGKKDTGSKLYAPISGNLIALTDVSDPVFAQKMLGDGVAIEPAEGKVYAPCDATVTTVMDTKHALGLTAADGVEVLIHVGMDTVSLGGEGFTPHVGEGDKVKKGDLLLEFDMEFIKGKGLPLVTPMIIANMDAVKDMTPAAGSAVAGETVAVTYQKA